MKDNSIKNNAIKSTLFVFLGQVFSRLLTFTKIIVLSRILTPADFGTIGIALLTYSTMEILTKTGFDEKLVQERELHDKLISTTWVVNIIRGFLIMIILVLGSRTIESFFNQPKIAQVTNIIAIAAFVKGLTNTKLILFQKKLQFKTLFLIDIGRILVDFFASVTFAIYLKNAMALALGYLFGTITYTLLSFTTKIGTPSFKFEYKTAMKMFKFGKWVWLASLLVFIITNGDDAFVGKFLGITALGLYQMAYKISTLVISDVTYVISKVSFPFYSLFQSNVKKLMKSYIHILKITAFIVTPLSLGIFVVADKLTLVFLGEKWAGMIPALRILALAGLIRAIIATAGSLFYSVGKPYIDAKWQIVRFITMAVTIYPLTKKYNIIGTSISILISIASIVIPFIFNVQKLTNIKTNEIMKAIMYPLISSVAMVTVARLITVSIKTNDSLSLLIFVITALLIYLIAQYIWDKWFGYDIKVLIKNILFTFKNA